VLEVGVALGVRQFLFNRYNVDGACRTSQAYYTLDPMGNVRPCNHSPTVLGNLLSHSLESLSRSELMSNFKQARPAFCAGCAVEKECQGGCKAAAEVCYGDLAACEPFLKINLARANRRSTRTAR
jgi:radical SAM protein with 4Fe4S-binding SPASM domain